MCVTKTIKVKHFLFVVVNYIDYQFVRFALNIQMLTFDCGDHIIEHIFRFPFHFPDHVASDNIYSMINKIVCNSNLKQVLIKNIYNFL